MCRSSRRNTVASSSLSPIGSRALRSLRRVSVAHLGRYDGRFISGNTETMNNMTEKNLTAFYFAPFLPPPSPRLINCNFENRVIYPSNARTDCKTVLTVFIFVLKAISIFAVLFFIFCLPITVRNFG